MGLRLNLLRTCSDTQTKWTGMKISHSVYIPNFWSVGTYYNNCCCTGCIKTIKKYILGAFRIFMGYGETRYCLFIVSIILRYIVAYDFERLELFNTWKRPLSKLRFTKQSVGSQYGVQARERSDSLSMRLLGYGWIDTDVTDGCQ